MAIYEVPLYTLRTCLMTPVESVGEARYGSGLHVSLTETMETMWRVNVTTIPLTASGRASWRAWRNKLRGGLDMFSMYDVSKKTPAAYPSAEASTDISGAWDGTAGVSSLGASGSLGLSSLPVGYVVSEDDYISLEEGGLYDMYAVTTGGTANGSGAVTVTVRPFLRTGIFTTSAVARLWQPKATFILDRASWSEDGDVSPSPISFSGMQRI